MHGWPPNRLSNYMFSRVLGNRYTINDSKAPSSRKVTASMVDPERPFTADVRNGGAYGTVCLTDPTNDLIAFAVRYRSTTFYLSTRTLHPQ